MPKTMYPEDSAARKNIPIAEGLLDYFPDACAYVAFVSKIGNDQHNPGEKMHWAREKSTDQRDCIARHLAQAGTYDNRGVLHSGGLAWRAFANLQLELEQKRKQGHDIWALFGGQKPVPGDTPGTFTGMVTVNEHAHGDDHHDHHVRANDGHGAA